MVHWLYTVIVRPMLTYDAVVWWPCLKTAKKKKSITQVQILACVGITSDMKTASMASLEAFLDFAPVLINFEGEEARAAVCRLLQSEQWRVLHIILLL